MRQGYSHIGGGSNYQSFILNRTDLEKMLSDYFGLDPASVELNGIEIEKGEFRIGGEKLKVNDEPEESVPAPGL